MYKGKLAVQFLIWAQVILAGFSFAQAEDVSLEKIVVTPYRSGVSTQENPSSTTVINVDEQESAGKFSFVDLIKGTQGVDYAVTGGLEGISSIYIRGADSYQTQLMVDGVRVYDTINTQGYFAYYNYLSLDNLDKVEVSRGPFSSLYGSQSIGGSINMITHKGSGKPTFSYLQEFGSYDTYREKIASQGKIDKLAYSLGVSRVDVNSFYSAKYKNGNHERDPFRNTNTSLRLDYALTDNLGIGVSQRYAYAKYNYDDGNTVPPSDDLDNTARYHQNIGAFYLNNRINDLISHKFTYGFVGIQRKGWEGYNAFVGGESNYWFDSRSNQFKYEFNYKPAKFYEALVGFEYTGERGEYYWDGYEPKHRANSKGVYVQNIVRPVEDLFFSFILRSEDHSTFGEHDTYGLSGSYFIELTNTKLKGSVGTGFRSPSLYELFSSWSGKRDLVPEKSKSQEVGFEQYFLDNKFSLGSTYFHNEIENLIEYNSTTFAYDNTGEAEIYGIENFGEYKFSEKTNLRLTYDYLHTRKKSDKSRLLRRPENKFALTFNTEVANLKIIPELYFVGNRIDSSGGSTFKLKPYILANLSLNYKVNNNLEIFSRTENILNYNYELVYGYQTLGSSFYAGAKLSF